MTDPIQTSQVPFAWQDEYKARRDRVVARELANPPRLQVGPDFLTPKQLSDSITQDTRQMIQDMSAGLLGYDEYQQRYADVVGRTRSLGEYVASMLDTYGIVPNQPKGASIFDDDFIQTIIKAPPDIQARFLFWQDPSDPEANPWRLKKDMLEGGVGLTSESGGKGHRSFWNHVTDMAGDSWGALTNILTWPAEQVEFQVYDNILRLAIDDDEARRIVANNGYRIGFSMLADHDMARDLVHAVNQDHRLAEMEKLSPAAEGPYMRTREFSERTNWLGIVGDFVGKVGADPLWLFPPAKGLAGSLLYGEELMKAGWVAGRAEGIIKGMEVGGEAGKPAFTVLPRLGRFLAGGEKAAQANQVARAMRSDLFMLARGELSHTPGFFGFLGRRMPQGLGIETMRSVASVLESNWLDDTTKSADDIVKFFDDIARSPGRESAVEAVGKSGWGELSVNPETSRFASYLKGSKKGLFEDNLPERLDILRKAGVSESLIRTGVIDNILKTHGDQLVEQLMGKMPVWYTKVVRPLISAQKRVMSILTLNKPSFLSLNFGYDGFVGLISAPLRFPTRIIQSMKPFGKLPVIDDYAKAIAKVGGDPVLHEQFVADSTFMREVLGEVKSDTFDLTEAQKLVESVFGEAPKTSGWGQKLQRAMSVNVAIATKFADLPTRRMLYGEALMQKLHFAEDFVSKGGLVDDLPKELLASMPDWSTDMLLEEIRRQPMTAGGLKQAMSEFERRLVSDQGVERLSANMLKSRFVREVRGLSDPMAQKVVARDFDEPARMLMDAIEEAKGKGIPLTTDDIAEQLGIIRDSYYTKANLLHEISRIAPIVSPGPGMEKARVLNLEAAKQMVMDEVGHVERLVESAFGGTLAAADRGRLMRKLADYHSFDLQNADRIWRELMEYQLPQDEVARIASGARKAAQGKGVDEDSLIRSAISRAHRTGRNKIAAQFDAHYQQSLKNLDSLSEYTVNMLREKDWVSAQLVQEFFGLRRTARTDHLGLIRGAMRDGKAAVTREEFAKIWEDYGTKVSRLYEDLANDHGNLLFAWGPNEPGYQNLRSPTNRQTEMLAFRAHQVDEFLGWAGNLIQKDWDVLTGQKMDRLPTLWKDGLDSWAGKLAPQRADHGMAVKIAAYEHASFGLTSYERQYGFDHLLQIFAPFEFFPSRILWNWGRRTWDNPAAVSSLFKMADSSSDASEKVWREQAKNALVTYGMSEKEANQVVRQMKLPNKFRRMVPIPMPFLSQIPGIGQIVKGAGIQSLGEFGWIDPLVYFNPMEFQAREFYDDERRRSTMLGRAVDWTAKNTPFGPSPLWTQIGSISGLLPERHAWTNVLISGMPFGLPNTRASRALLSFMGTGNDLGELSDEEKTFLVNNEYIPETLLRRIIKLPPGDSFEQYLIDRTMSSLLFTGDLDPSVFTKEELGQWQSLSQNKHRTEEEQSQYMDLRSIRSARALESMKDRSGPAYAQARLQASRERGLRDITGWLGFRINPFLEGDLISRGLKVLHDEAAAGGNLATFYDRFPEYQLKDVASADFDPNDPNARAVELDTTLYWFERNRVSSVYEETINNLESARTWMEASDQTPDVQLSLRDVKAQLSDTFTTMNAAIDKLEEVYPLRTEAASLMTDPKVKAMRDLRTAYYGIEQDSTIADKSDRWDDLTAKQDAFLNNLRPRTAQDSSIDWWNLRLDMLRTNLGYQKKLDLAYGQGQFDTAGKLKEERDHTLQTVHDLAANRVTRSEFELFLNGGWKMPTQTQVDFNKAQAMFDQLMALLSDNSPLSGRQKAGAVDGYLADPLFKKYFGDKFIDPFETQGWMLQDEKVQTYFGSCPGNAITACAIARRRDIFDHYGNLDRGRPKVDYLRSVLDELNTVQRVLGLPPYQLYEPATPKVSLPWMMPTESDIDQLSLSISRRGY